MSFQDPYYLVHDEIEANLSRVMRQEQSLTNGQGAVSNDAKRTLAEMDEQLDSVDFQLQELNEAMKLAEANPARFRIDHEEIRSRKSYIEGAQSRAKKLRGTVQQTRAEMVRAEQERQRRYAPVKEVNDDFIGDQEEQQAMMLQRQDSSLEELGSHVLRLGDLGRSIGEELEQQNTMIEELEDDIDHTQGSLAAAKKKVTDLLQKNGKCQIASMIVLGGILLVLVILVFM